MKLQHVKPASRWLLYIAEWLGIRLNGFQLGPLHLELTCGRCEEPPGRHVLKCLNRVAQLDVRR